mgnify:CR=1 FL=1
MPKLMGFVGKLYWGSPGTTAATELTIARDVNYKFEPVEGDVSDRASLIELVDVAMIKYSLEFEVNNKDTDSFIAALRTAAATGAAIALANQKAVEEKAALEKSSSERIIFGLSVGALLAFFIGIGLGSSSRKTAAAQAKVSSG